MNLTGGQTTAQRNAVCRCAALTVAAERTRNDFLRGAATVVDIDMVERALVRAEKHLAKLACEPPPVPVEVKPSGLSYADAMARANNLHSTPQRQPDDDGAAKNRF